MEIEGPDPSASLLLQSPPTAEAPPPNPKDHVED